MGYQNIIKSNRPDNDFIGKKHSPSDLIKPVLKTWQKLTLNQ